MSNLTFEIISIDPTSEYEWNRYNVRDVFSSNDIDLKDLVAAGLAKGDYLVRLTVSIEVVKAQTEQEPEVLERDDSQSIAF